MIKMVCRLVAFVAVVLVATVTIIKFVQGVSFKEAVGIMEELCKEMSKNCCCCRPKVEEPAPEA